MNDIINVLNEAEFSFIKGGRDIYFIEKDVYLVLYPFISIDQGMIDEFIKSPYKTIIRDSRGEIIMKNFDVGGGKDKKTLDLTTVHELLLEVETVYNSKQKLLEDIDKALSDGNRKLFIELTNQLKEVS